MKYEVILTTRELPTKRDMRLGKVEGNFNTIARFVEYGMKKYGYDAYFLKKLEKKC